MNDGASGVWTMNGMGAGLGEQTALSNLLPRVVAHRTPGESMDGRRWCEWVRVSMISRADQDLDCCSLIDSTDGVVGGRGQSRHAQQFQRRVRGRLPCSPAHQLTTAPGPLSFDLAGLTEEGDGGDGGCCLSRQSSVAQRAAAQQLQGAEPHAGPGQHPRNMPALQSARRARRKGNPNVCASADSACCLLHLLSAATILPTCGGVGLGVRIGPGCG